MTLLALGGGAFASRARANSAARSAARWFTPRPSNPTQPADNAERRVTHGWTKSRGPDFERLVAGPFIGAPSERQVAGVAGVSASGDGNTLADEQGSANKFAARQRGTRPRHGPPATCLPRLGGHRAVHRAQPVRV